MDFHTEHPVHIGQQIEIQLALGARTENVAGTRTPIHHVIPGALPAPSAPSPATPMKQ
jgi:hypothetical protein